MSFETTRHESRIITFYSFKGGAGRTMALANVAWLLAASGYRVLAADWDLVSPGLEKFFLPLTGREDFAARRGVVPLLQDYAYARSSDPDADIASFAEVRDHVVPVRWDFAKGGLLDLLPAGVWQDAGRYAPMMERFNWDVFYQDLDGDRFFDALKQVFRRDYDFALIDSRTGLSDIGDTCTVVLPDTLVMCFTLNNQSFEGAAGVAERIVNGSRLSGDFTIRPVPMRVEAAETERLNAGRAAARLRFDRFLQDKRGAELDRYWDEVEIPYRPFYAYEEVLAAFAEQTNATTGILSAYQHMARMICDVEIAPVNLADPARRRVLSAFIRQLPPEPVDFFLSHAPEDRPWAAWLTSLLASQGHSVRWQSDLADPDDEQQVRVAITAATRAVVLVSEAYRRSSEHYAFRSALQLADPGNARSLVALFRVDPASLEPVFGMRPRNELDVADEPTAVHRVASTLLEKDTIDIPEGLRYPGSKPPVWQMPERNPYFTGRNRLIEQVRSQLRTGGAASLQPQALHAVGGFGKTQIATEYAYRYKADYDIVWWIRSENANRAADALVELGGHLRVRAGSTTDVIAAVKNALRTGKPYPRALLIFDNVGEYRDIEPLMPTGSDVHILITTRDREVAGNSGTIGVDTFTREESIDLLRRLTENRLGRDDAHRLAEALGDLPIVIDAAGRHIADTQESVDSYLALIRSTGGNAYDQVWAAAVEASERSSPAARCTLDLLAYFGGEPVARELYYSGHFTTALQAYAPEAEVDDALQGSYLRVLSRFGLVRVDPVHGVTVHRALQQWLRNRMAANGDGERARTAVQQILVASRPTGGDPDDPGYGETFSRIWPHIYDCRADESTDRRVRQLTIDRIRYLRLSGRLEEARTTAEPRLAKWADVSGPQDTAVIGLQLELANVLRAEGQAKRAFELDTDVRDLLVQMLGSTDHPAVLTAMSNVAADERSLGRFSEALATDRAVFNASSQVTELGRDRLRAAGNLGLSQRLAGDCFGARDRDRITYDDSKRILGTDHPWTLQTATNLARDLRDCGQFEESRRLLERTCERAAARFGDYHPAFMWASLGMAVTLRRSGQHARAWSITQNLVPRFRAVFGAKAPASLACEVNLACDKSAAGDKAGALADASRLHEAFAESMGPQHPNTLACANNKAIYLRTTKQPGLARELAATTLRSFAEALGDRHPFTLSCALNHANAVADLAQSDKSLTKDALALFGEIAEQSRAELGEEHPDHLAARAGRIIALHEAGETAKARSERDRVLAGMIAVLGEEHQNVIALREWRRINRDLEPYQL